MALLLAGACGALGGQDRPPDPAASSEGTDASEVATEERESSASLRSPGGVDADSPAVAPFPGPPEVVYVRGIQEGETEWRFEVTLRHTAADGENRVDGWNLVLSDGSVVRPDPESEFTMAVEQPIGSDAVTLERAGLQIPIEEQEVTVVVHASESGFGSSVRLYMWATGGAGFELTHTY